MIKNHGKNGDLMVENKSSLSLNTLICDVNDMQIHMMARLQAVVLCSICEISHN